MFSGKSFRFWMLFSGLVLSGLVDVSGLLLSGLVFVVFGFNCSRF